MQNLQFKVHSSGFEGLEVEAKKQVDRGRKTSKQSIDD
jgi:hypothetical protein